MELLCIMRHSAKQTAALWQRISNCALANCQCDCPSGRDSALGFVDDGAVSQAVAVQGMPLVSHHSLSEEMPLINPRCRAPFLHLVHDASVPSSISFTTSSSVVRPCRRPESFIM